MQGLRSGNESGKRKSIDLNTQQQLGENNFELSTNFYQAEF